MGFRADDLGSGTPSRPDSCVGSRLGSLLGLFLLGTLNRRSNAIGALAGMFAGLSLFLCMASDKYRVHVVCVNRFHYNFFGRLVVKSLDGADKSVNQRATVDAVH